MDAIVTDINEYRLRKSGFFDNWPTDHIEQRIKVLASIEEGGWSEPLEEGTGLNRMVFPDGRDPSNPENSLPALRAELARRTGEVT